jgi:aminoglycoside phosphotransferase (APT) family kinase protein
MLVHLARLLAELHADMHTHRVPALPSQRQRLETRIRESGTLSPPLEAAALKALNEMPNLDRLCHGDFHPDNVLMTNQGPVIIDWMDAASGNPLSDVARTSLLFAVATLPPGIPIPIRWLMEALRYAFRSVYLSHYFQLRPGDRWQLEAWQPLVAAARLWESIPGEREQQIVRVEAGLSPHG